jgi:hypothetical protein
MSTELVDFWAFYGKRKTQQNNVTVFGSDCGAVPFNRTGIVFMGYIHYIFVKKAFDIKIVSGMLNWTLREGAV